MVRCMNRSRCEVGKERFVWGHRLLGLDPLDRLIGHVCGEVVVLARFGSHPGDSIINKRVPLIGLTTDEAVEFVESLMGWPAIEGA